MGFASVGTLGHNSEKTASDREISLSPSSNVPAGHLVVVWVASTGDSWYFDGHHIRDDWPEIEDSVGGNIWVQLIAGLDGGAAGTKACYAIFCCQLTTGLTTSDTITVRARNLLTSGDWNAKAISAWEFSLDNGMVWAAFEQRSDARDDPDAGDARGGDIGISGIPSSTECLILHALASARPFTDTYSWDADYTQIDADGTSSGGGINDITLRGGWRIATLTSDTVSVSDTTADSPIILQGICALTQVPYDGDFPTFPNLDDFNRADQDPLPQPPWANPVDRPGQGDALIRNVSNQAARSTTGSVHGSMYYGVTVPAGDDGEIFATMAVKGYAALFAFASGSGYDSTLSSYGTIWDKKDFFTSGHNHDFIQWGENGGPSACIRAFANMADGCKWGIQMRNLGVLLHLWVDLADSKGWRWAGCTWQTSFVHNGGKFGLSFRSDTVTRIDDFGGGTSSKVIGDIIRRMA